jgi:hypothetical protein
MENILLTMDMSIYMILAMKEIHGQKIPMHLK